MTDHGGLANRPFGVVGACLVWLLTLGSTDGRELDEVLAIFLKPSALRRHLNPIKQGRNLPWLMLGKQIQLESESNGP